MNPIQTRYQGYHFRSRLEARWAVFFETLGLKWEYEPEGFVLPNGDYYLPDFRVHYPGREDVPQEADDHWFEVKGDIDQITETEWSKMQAFHKGLILLDGVPSMRMYLDVFSVKEYSLDHTPEKMRKFERYGNALWSNKRRLWHCQDYESWFPPGGCGYWNGVAQPWFAHHQSACDAARSARFEHGSCGPT